MTALNLSVMSTLTADQVANLQILFALNNALIVNNARMNIFYTLIWNNPDQTNASADKVWTALGTNAVLIRTIFLSMSTMLNGINPGTVPAEPAGWTITQNQDGSITASKNS